MSLNLKTDIKQRVIPNIGDLFMIDTINIMIPALIVKEHGGYNPLIRKLDAYRRGSEYEFHGRVKNLYIRGHYGKVHIYGSLAKFYWGNNQEHLNHLMALGAIKILENRLGIPLDDAFITRLDFGFNFPVDAPVKDYLSILQMARGYDCDDSYLPNGLYFNQQSKRMVFYDKKVELASKNQAAIKRYKHTNVLRYEIRFFSPLIATFNKNILISDLTNRDFLNRVLSKYLTEYRRIIKPRQFIDSSEWRTEGAVSRFYALKGMESAGGEHGICKSIEEQKKLMLDRGKKEINADSKNSAHISSVYSSPEFLRSNELVLELDSLILKNVFDFSIP